jgi:predicted alpha/beta hydrolase family esterase
MGREARHVPQNRRGPTRRCRSLTERPGQQAHSAEIAHHVDGRDPVVPLANAEFLVERLPNAELAAIEAGHFVWEDAAEEYARHVTTWWSKTWMSRIAIMASAGHGRPRYTA